MASIIARGLDDHVKQQLASQAKENGRSVVAKVRDILTKAARRTHIGVALLVVARDVGGVEELPMPTQRRAGVRGRRSGSTVPGEPVLDRIRC